MLFLQAADLPTDKDALNCSSLLPFKIPDSQQLARAAYIEIALLIYRVCVVGLL